MLSSDIILKGDNIMAKKVGEIKATRFEYTVINDTFYLEIVDGVDVFRGEEIPYFHCYIQHGKWGVKRFCYSCPQTDMTTGKRISVEDAAESAENFLLHSVVEYLEEEEAVDAYYARKEFYDNEE